MLHKAVVAGMTMDPASNNPIIFLKTEKDGQVIPIWIGLLEATSIAAVMQNVAFERPMTHDLFKSFIRRIDADLSKIEICDLRDNTFFARLFFTIEDRQFDMDARPSDAIAIALRLDAPIYVDDKVIEKSVGDDTPGEMVDKSKDGEKWAEYLENLSPEAFGKYKI